MIDASNADTIQEANEQAGTDKFAGVCVAPERIGHVKHKEGNEVVWCPVAALPNGRNH